MPSPTPSPAASAEVRVSSTFYSSGTRAPRSDTVLDHDDRRIIRADAVELDSRWYHRSDPVLFRCECCGELRHATSATTVLVGRRTGRTWCRTCNEARTWTCHNCSTHVSNDVAVAEDDNENAICPNCAPAVPDIFGRLINYSNKDVAKIKSEDSSGILFGLEVETHVTNDHPIDDIITRLHNKIGPGYYVTKSDGSLVHGFEIVTRPDGMAVHRKHWARIFEAIHGDQVLKDHLRAWTAPRACAGMHCHIDKSMLSPLHLGKLRTFLNSPDTRDFVEKVAGRSGSNYAQYDGNAKIKDGRQLKSGTSPARYTALNVTQVTAEVRIFRSTLNPGKFFTNLDFLEAVVHWTGLGNSSIRDVNSVPVFARYVRKNRAHFPYLADRLDEWNILSAPNDK